jgi:16S rRNA (adenine1518-N6/adenine1519-N6)-dimethyltransferase
MLRQSLRALATDPAPLLAAAGIEGTSRAEEIDIAGFAGLARAWSEAEGRGGG